MKNKVFITIIAVIFTAGVIGSVLVLTAPSKSHVRIVSDGETVYAADLSRTGDTTFDINYQGHTNTVEIKNHRIHVLKADCPDQTCVNMGWLSSSSMPIVCLPHRLVIEFTDLTDDIDSAAR